MAQPLPNYLRTHRKRSGFTQGELAFLLGRSCGTKVSRYETFRRLPNLETAFAFEIVFGREARGLFPGPYLRARLTVRKRAHVLAKRLAKTSGAKQARKQELLKALLERSNLRRTRR